MNKNQSSENTTAMFLIACASTIILKQEIVPSKITFKSATKAQVCYNYKHDKKPTDDQISQIEALLNEWIKCNDNCKFSIKYEENLKSKDEINYNNLPHGLIDEKDGKENTFYMIKMTCDELNFNYTSNVLPISEINTLKGIKLIKVGF